MVASCKFRAAEGEKTPIATSMPSSDKLCTTKQNMDPTEPQELSETKKSYAGIPEAQFVVNIVV